ncbi:hypothetical protein EDC18_11536 [Natranaerovirga pectinivora]|uniref:GAF domain-containing protein n=1 Tax=Natranaerovirga pectinivora TaxID=682400 RepID=A0A4R3MDX7_9FIRM|nr:hypothetical protein [Natranaerovirga pectinivora]TCT11691.1 hypothetical protein EDC18_11536 [Natranaerovirga pectinivora]
MTENNTSKLTTANNYSSILKAIDFFTQRFDIDQIIEYAFTFCKEILKPDTIILWTLKENNFSVSHSNIENAHYSFPYCNRYDEIVYFHAGLIYKDNLSNLLPKEIQNKYDPDFCIPLIMDKGLYGIIALNRHTENPFDTEDELLASSLMNLFSMSLTNYIFYKNLEETKIKLNEKVFNLFAINHSTKALLSELSLDNLYDLAIGVFSELTQSSFTTFFIKDSISENYKLMNYRNVDLYSTSLELTLFENKNCSFNLPIVIDMSIDHLKDRFIQTFYNGNEILTKINPSYIVLIKKNNALVGFVTLGEKVNGADYDPSIFELVESLASSTYIAINNSLYFEEIKKQKNLVNSKLNELIRLNNLMKNINTATSLERTISLVMNTLNISFDVDMGFFALYDSQLHQFTVSYNLNIMPNNCIIKVSPKLMPLLEGYKVIEYNVDYLSDYLTPDLLELLNESASGLVMIPIYIQNTEIELIGFFAILKNKNSVLLTDENIVSYNAIATHIAPVIYQLKNIDTIKQSYLPNYPKQFIDKLEAEMRDALDFELDLYILHIYCHKKSSLYPMSITNTILNKYKKVYPIDYNTMFIISNDRLELEAIVPLIVDGYNYYYYTFKKDFNDLKSFESLL